MRTPHTTVRTNKHADSICKTGRVSTETHPVFVLLRQILYF